MQVRANLEMAREEDDGEGRPRPSHTTFDPVLFDKLVYACTRRIPKARVTTYGEIARLCHHPRYSRHVGKALRRLPEDTDVPWQRVINAASTISPRGDGGVAARRQAERLIAEGIAVTQDAMGVWKVPRSAHWDTAGAGCLEDLLGRGGGRNKTKKKKEKEKGKDKDREGSGPKRQRREEGGGDAVAVKEEENEDED